MAEEQPSVVLATKCYVDGTARERAMDSLRSLLNNEIGELDVSVDLRIREDDFPVATFEGVDATAAANVIREVWGEIRTDGEPGAVATGTLESWDSEGFTLDAGRDVRIPTAELGLGPGDASQIRKRFGLVQHVPLEFVDDDPPRLTDAQRDELFEWQRGTGRVNVNSATRAEVRATVNRAGHAQDIVTVERLGLLEQSIICTESTDPPGLLASIGEYLPAEIYCVV